MGSVEVTGGGTGLEKPSWRTSRQQGRLPAVNLSLGSNAIQLVIQTLRFTAAAALLALPLWCPGSAQAQKRIPKLPGYDECPLGYVNDLKQHCNSPIYYEVKPSNGEPCDSGWMNIGAGYCKKKTLGIF